MKKMLVFCCLSLILTTSANSQKIPPLKDFWQQVSAMYKYKQMDIGMRYWLNGLAEKQTGNFFKGVALLKDLEHAPALQDKIFLSAYQAHQNREMLRRIMAVMCGSFSIGNQVADYLYSKYSQDPSVIKLIAKTKERKVKQERERKNQQEINSRIEEEKEKVEKEEDEKETIIDESEYAQFPGGEQAYIRFLSNNLSSDSAGGVSGTVIVEFTVDTTGKVINPRIISEPLGHGLEEEVLRVINLSPQFIPTKRNNLPINSIRHQSISF